MIDNEGFLSLYGKTIRSCARHELGYCIMKKILLLAFLCLETMFAFGQQSKDELLLKAGDREAQMDLALSYFNNYRNGKKEDINLFQSWLKKAADSRDLTAMVTLGEAYINGDFGLSRDRSKAIEWLKECMNTCYFYYGENYKDMGFYKTSVNLLGELGVSYSPSAKKSWYSVCENGKYGVKFNDGSTFVPAQYQSVRLKKVAGEIMFEARRDDGSKVYYSVKKESLLGNYDYFGDESLRIYGIKSTVSVGKQNIIYVYTENGLGAYLEDTENNTVEIILDPSTQFEDLRYVNHYFEYKDTNGNWKSTEFTMELPYVKYAKTLCGMIPSDTRKKFDDREYSDLYKLQIMAKGYKDAVEEFSYRKLSVIYDSDALYPGSEYYSSIDNEAVEYIYPMLKLLADSGNANAQFLMGCVCSGNKVIAVIAQEDIKTPKDYKYLDDNLAIGYFQKFMKNTQKTKNLPFGKSLSELNTLIRKVYPRAFAVSNKGNKR